MKNQKINELRTLIETAGSSIFNVKFVKKDGTLRSMNCRLKVHKHLKGGKNTTEHISKYLTVYDMQKQGYRNINLETIQELTILGHKYAV